MKNYIFAIFGIVFGSIALLLALTHFWAGSFSPPPLHAASIESNIHKKITSIRKTAIDAIKGNPRQTNSSNLTVEKPKDLDKLANIITALFAGFAIIFGAIAYAKKEPVQAAGSAMGLGAGAIAMQIFSIYFTWFIIALIIIGLVLAFANGGV